MKVGKSLVELAHEIERQQKSKKDIVAPTDKISMNVIEGEFTEVDGGKAKRPTLAVGIGGEHQFGINKIAHRQLGEHVGIPATYYDRMLAEKPELLAKNVNTWLNENPQPRLVRTLDGNARAFLSDRYRPLENADLAEAVLPVLMRSNLQILSCEITERRLYIKAVDENINKQVPVKGKRMGDGSHVIFDCLSPGIVISNSEVGMGALSVETAVWTKACTNLAIFGQRSLRKYHVGGKHEISEGLYNVLSDKTRKLTDAATWAQVRDVVGSALDEAKFDAMVTEINNMTEQKIEGAVVKVVDFAAKKFGANEGEKDSILKHLIEGGDLTKYGLFNAFTRTAEDLDSYDRATEFERIGGKIIELANDEWRQIAEAA